MKVACLYAGRLCLSMIVIVSLLVDCIGIYAISWYVHYFFENCGHVCVLLLSACSCKHAFDGFHVTSVTYLPLSVHV